MSLKDNFNQALKEVLKRDGIVGDELKESKKKSELDKYLEPTARSAESLEKAVRAEEESPADEAVGEIAAADTDIGDIGESIFSDSDEPESLMPDSTVTSSADVSSYDSPYIKPEQNVSQFGANPAAEKTPLTGGSEVFGGVAEPETGTSPFSQFSQYARRSGAAARAEEAMRSNPYDNGSYSGGYNGSSQGYSGGNTPPPPPPRTPRSSPFGGNEPDNPYYETEETTVISRNTIIDGNIRSFANINIDGSVKGDVRITKNISVTGKVVGDIECNNSVMAGASMQGNIASKGQVQIDRDSLLLGDITAQYLDLNGKVKGNVDVGGKAEFKTDAVILGNITASTITVLDGATIQGYVNTTFLQESSSSIFPEAIALSE
jgi:cytoskeletal protein CcmA (bactofilin family)